MGALLAPASRTIRMMEASMVSSPTFSALILRYPLVTMDALVACMPSVNSTGRLSPVTADWSAKACPSQIVPSTATDSPCRTTMISPIATSETGTFSVFPSRSTVTVSGASERSFSTSLPVRRLLLSSNHLPSVTNVTIIAADSKKSVGSSGVRIAMTRL